MNYNIFHYFPTMTSIRLKVRNLRNNDSINGNDKLLLNLFLIVYTGISNELRSQLLWI